MKAVCKCNINPRSSYELLGIFCNLSILKLYIIKMK
nr:MAG TPA: hypothetical protein [Caudoviricetes sp.]